MHDKTWLLQQNLMSYDEMDEDDERPVNLRCKASDWQAALEPIMSPSELRQQRDISECANWSLSSCKVDGDGFGIHELLADPMDLYWQSDGPQPHSVLVEFSRKTDMSFLLLYLDYKSDESYTPSKIFVSTGSSISLLGETYEHSFAEPLGWQAIDLRIDGAPRRDFVLLLQVVANHQNGRDTHIRHMRVIGPAHSQHDTGARMLHNPQLMRGVAAMEAKKTTIENDPLVAGLRLHALPGLLPARNTAGSTVPVTGAAPSVDPLVAGLSSFPPLPPLTSLSRQMNGLGIIR